MPSNKICSTRVVLPISHDPKGFEQTLERQNTYDRKKKKKKKTYDDPCNSNLANTTLVPRSNENVHTPTNFTELEEVSLKKSKGRNPFPCPKQNFKISGMNGLRARLQTEGV